MGRMDTARAIRRYVIGNDADRPTVVLWTVATPKEWDEYERGLFQEINPRSGRIVLTADNAYRSAKRMVDFALSRIVGVEAFEIANGDGSTHELTWPQDRERIVECLSEHIGEMETFVREVRRAHQAREEELPSGN